jgi:hypothetical protein
VRFLAVASAVLVGLLKLARVIFSLMLVLRLLRLRVLYRLLVVLPPFPVPLRLPHFRAVVRLRLATLVLLFSRVRFNPLRAWGFLYGTSSSGLMCYQLVRLRLRSKDRNAPAFCLGRVLNSLALPFLPLKVW